MTDLFLATKPSKKEQIYDYIKSKGRARTSEIIRYGLSIYCNRAERSARDLAKENKIWRINSLVKMSIPEYRLSKEEVWSVYPSDK